ncbi:unnamed protein product [Ectocarpus sp. 4 AP-2014]
MMVPLGTRMDAHEGARAQRFGENVGGSAWRWTKRSCFASRAQRPCCAGGGGSRRSSCVGVGVSREERRRCWPGVRGPGEGRPDRGQEGWQEGAVRGGLT